jgi:hypothetical protein
MGNCCAAVTGSEEVQVECGVVDQCHSDVINDLCFVSESVTASASEDEACAYFTP